MFPNLFGSVPIIRFAGKQKELQPQFRGDFLVAGVPFLDEACLDFRSPESVWKVFAVIRGHGNWNGKFPISRDFLW